MCDECGDEGGKVTECEQFGKIRAIFGECCRWTGNGTSKDFRGPKIKQDKGCMPPRGGNCRFTPTGNAVREVQSVLPFTICVKVGIPM